jgi:hypothetical protein
VLAQEGEIRDGSHPLLAVRLIVLPNG